MLVEVRNSLQELQWILAMVHRVPGPAEARGPAAGPQRPAGPR